MVCRESFLSRCRKFDGITSTEQQPKVPTETANKNIDTAQERQNCEKML